MSDVAPSGVTCRDPTLHHESVPSAVGQMTEEVIWLPCAGEHLLAVHHQGDADVGVVIIVGGPQYRVGSHRQFVLLARHLARAGIPTLRFDLRGMGDSGGAFPTFERCSDDVQAAINGLMTAAPTVRRVVLWGLCDGASAALLYLQREPRDTRVVGVCLVNPWVRSAQTLAQARVKHYYRQRLMDPSFWRKLVSGGVSWQAPLEWWKARRQAQSRTASPTATLTFQQRMRLGLKALQGEALVVLSGRDLTAKEFEQACEADAAWREVMSGPRITLQQVPTADHTFSFAGDQATMFDATLAWLESRLAPQRPQPRIHA